MRSTIATAAQTTPDKLDVIGRPKMAKVTTPDNREDNGLSPLAKAAVSSAWGTQEAAATHLQKDKGNFSRDIDAGRMTLAQMEALGPDFLATLGAGLVRQYAPLSDPKDYIRQQIRAIRKAVDEVAQFVEGA